MKRDLKHFVRTGFDSGNQIGRTEGGLLNFGEVIFWVAIEHHLADRLQREVLLRPNLGEVKWVKVPLPGLFECHDLDVPKFTLKWIKFVVRVELPKTHFSTKVKIGGLGKPG